MARPDFGAIVIMGSDYATLIFGDHREKVAGSDAMGKPLFQRKLRRPKLMQFVATCQPRSTGMQECSGSQHLARRFIQFGPDVKL